MFISILCSSFILLIDEHVVGWSSGLDGIVLLAVDSGIWQRLDCGHFEESPENLIIKIEWIIFERINSLAAVFPINCVQLWKLRFVLKQHSIECIHAPFNFIQFVATAFLQNWTLRENNQIICWSKLSLKLTQGSASSFIRRAKRRHAAASNDSDWRQKRKDISDVSRMYRANVNVCMSVLET